MHVHTLIRIDTRSISDDINEIRTFMNVRNESLRLSQTLDHYRKIGVSRFFVTDNGSNDGTREFLLTQPDCHVFVTSNSYSESGYGVEWQNALLNEYGMNHWCLMVDADEWFVYPGYETRSLAELAHYLDHSGAQGMFSFLLDMYGSGPIVKSTSATDPSLLRDCPYFDKEYRWYRSFRIPGLQKPRFPPYNVAGGVRLRTFFPHLHRYLPLLRALWRVSGLSKVPLPTALQPAPALNKIPLVRWAPGMRFETSHLTTPIRLSEVTSVLLHFKFLQDFHRRILTEIERKEHWKKASEHSRYLAKLNKNPSLSFYYTGSLAYQGSEQLIRLRLLKEDQIWGQLRKGDDNGTNEGIKGAECEVSSQNTSKFDYVDR